MVNRDLLKEAIADAKAVKETAIANAKAALEESFGPYLKEKLAAKLAEMDNMDEEETMEEGKMKEKEMKENYDMEESLADMSTDEFLSFCKKNPDYPGCPGGMSEEKEKDMNEMDLDELLKELESMDEDEIMEDEMMEDETMEEGKAAYEYEKGKKAGRKETMNEDEDLLNNPKTPTAHGNVAEADEDKDEEIDVDNMDVKDLKAFIEEVIADMVADGKIEGEMEDKDDEMGDEMGDEEVKASEEEKVEVAEGLLDFLKKKKVEAPKKPSGPKLLGVDWDGNYIYDDDPRLKEVKAELEEAYKALSTIKTELQEVNLFNAKLLYTNKIFKAKNLTESQKVKVLTAFDKAASVKEAKLVFETLSEGFKEKKSSVNESLLRGSASKVAGVAEKKPILEVNNQFARWQTLAGIKK
jgi:hypothetical protein